jgi:hypothetical protein
LFHLLDKGESMTINEKKEFEEAVKKHWNAWSTGDAETIIEFESSRKSFGYRTFSLRDTGDIPRDRYLQEIKNFLDSLENYKIDFDIRYSEVFGNVGIVGGFVTESFITKSGKQMEVKNIRATNTYLKTDGQWHLIQSHRDIQAFEDPNQNIIDFITQSK